MSTISTSWASGDQDIGSCLSHLSIHSDSKSNSMSPQLACTKFQQVNTTAKRSLKKMHQKAHEECEISEEKKQWKWQLLFVCKEKTHKHFLIQWEGKNLHIFHPLPTLLTAGLPLTDGGTLLLSQRLRCEITIWIHARCTERGSGGRRINIQLFHYTWCDLAHHANQMPNLLAGRVQKSGNLAILQPRLASGF